MLIIKEPMTLADKILSMDPLDLSDDDKAIIERMLLKAGELELLK